MANIFLDTNAFFDIVLQRRDVGNLDIENNVLYISVLTIHIFTYVSKVSIPNEDLEKALGEYNIVALDNGISMKSLSGPTQDFEDNVQIHSAVEAECNCFVTNDKGLLKLGYFGKVKICNKITDKV